MIQCNNITKIYKSGDIETSVLKDVSMKQPWGRAHRVSVQGRIYNQKPKVSDTFLSGHPAAEPTGNTCYLI
ncbi:MAG: hypothetical protein A2908_03560 [Candidatus Staskawiczbacteria bacterium RIFCSPLOWO2_01_FULL_38_12b]|uniref:Uncharacterized protein n=1 Tax=Candidatus Staskawiczbacteria bacterium RIFCSPLOWO2_01_FULL_38_12b TaxID=1802214 RepID=A0A1G2IDE6_9BACT|nr:MAG: hypothetical protein A2908_03560 [Candidatus Staskawiczbacteria bacterium RIFCSPLOWO2_01_FULL_38_12b]